MQETKMFILGFLFLISSVAGIQLIENMLSNKETQALVVSQLATNHQNLVLSILQDNHLQGLLTGTYTPTNVQKQDVVLSIFINQFETVFELHRLGAIPERTWEAYKADMFASFASPRFRNRWAQVKVFHSKEFIEFVDGLIKKWNNS